ncbi:MAG: hydrogen peroxide-inducible genes activator [Bacteroidales bacterium]|nr:hydrogen peroxide-inducible genes activator [Bacteroidales bacterium]
MNIQQLEYVIAVDDCRHFAQAAAVCHVTQPTLSMMIQKLEDELNVKIFDRDKHPVEPTPTGKQIIAQARVSVRYFRQLKEMVMQERTLTGGSFTLGVIPTIASYLAPILLHETSRAPHEIELVLKEGTTSQLVQDILHGKIDGGVMASPLNHPELVEHPLYYEKFYAYVSPKDPLHKEKKIDLKKINIHNVWLLEEEHCLRGQVSRLCQLKQEAKQQHFEPTRYQSGSMDTLMNIVDYNGGITIIPEMHAMGIPEDRQENLREFAHVIAVREVSIVVSKDYVREALLQQVINMIRAIVPKSMQNPELKKFIVAL